MDAAMRRAFLRATIAKLRTAKSCGPGAATVASIRAGPCWRGNGDKKRRSPGRARISRKAIAWGKPGCLGCTCLIRVRCFHFCTRCCGRSQRPAFPAPSVREEGQRDTKPGRKPAAGIRTLACAGWPMDVAWPPGSTPGLTRCPAAIIPGADSPLVTSH